jgi:hypothetical protein
MRKPSDYSALGTQLCLVVAMLGRMCIADDMAAYPKKFLESFYKTLCQLLKSPGLILAYDDHKNTVPVAQNPYAAVTIAFHSKTASTPYTKGIKAVFPEKNSCVLKQLFATRNRVLSHPLIRRHLLFFVPNTMYKYFTFSYL